MTTQIGYAQGHPLTEDEVDNLLTWLQQTLTKAQQRAIHQGLAAACSAGDGCLCHEKGYQLAQETEQEWHRPPGQ